MKNIVIIGNGAAGNSAADTIRQHDPQIPIIMVAREELPRIFSLCPAGLLVGLGGAETAFY